MEAATQSFIRGMNYLTAARRVEAAGDDLKTRKALRRLAAVYRERANALMAGCEQPAQN